MCFAQLTGYEIVPCDNDVVLIQYPSSLDAADGDNYILGTRINVERTCKSKFLNGTVSAILPAYGKMQELTEFVDGRPIDRCTLGRVFGSRLFDLHMDFIGKGYRTDRLRRALQRFYGDQIPFGPGISSSNIFPTFEDPEDDESDKDPDEQ